VRLIILLVCGLMVAGPVFADDTVSLRDMVPAATPEATYETLWNADAGAEADAPVSPGKAVLYSLLLPGLGDYAMGNRGRATAFFAAEGIIWVSFAVFQVQGSQREDDYQNLAVQFAGVTRTGHSDDFYAKLREYDNSEEYEADVKLDGRLELSDNALYPDRVGAYALEQYFLDNRLADYEPWQWSSLDRRLQYSEVRSSSKTSYRRADYMLAAAAANRVVSAIVAYTAARSMNHDRTVGYRLDFQPATHGVDVSLMLTRSF